MRARASSSSPGPSSGPEHRAWSSVLCVPASGASWARAWQVPCWYSNFLDLAYQSPVQLPRWQTDVPKAHLFRSRSRQPQPTADCVHAYLTCREWGLSMASLSLCRVSSPGPPAQVAPGVLSPLCLSVHLSLPVLWPDGPSVSSADPSLKACSHTASATRLVSFPPSWGAGFLPLGFVLEPFHL